MQSQPARELTPEEVGSMTDEQLGHLGLDLSVNSYTLIANEAKRRKVKDIGGDTFHVWPRAIATALPSRCRHVPRAA